MEYNIPIPARLIEDLRNHRRKIHFFVQLNSDQVFRYKEGDVMTFYDGEVMRGGQKFMRVEIVWVKDFVCVPYERIVIDGEGEVNPLEWAKILGYRNWREMSNVFHDRHGKEVHGVIFEFKDTEKREIKEQLPYTIRHQKIYIPELGLVKTQGNLVKIDGKFVKIRDIVKLGYPLWKKLELLSASSEG